MAFRKNIPSRMNSKSTGSKAAVCFARSKSSKEACAAGAEHTRGRGRTEANETKQDGRWRGTWRASKARTGLWLLLPWEGFEQRSNRTHLVL